MSSYIPYQITLTESQKQHLSQAFKNKIISHAKTVIFTTSKWKYVTTSK